LASVILILVMGLGACAAAQQPAANTGNPGGNGAANGNGGQGAFNNFQLTADTPLEAKLAVGLLKLEGTNLAVTPAQAKQMLPLWQQVQNDMTAARGTPGAPGGGSGLSPEETQTASTYQEIEKLLTADQLKSLQEMTISGSDMRDLMTVLNVTPNAGNFGGPSAEQRATFAAEGTQVPGGFPAGQRATLQAEGTQVPGQNGTRTPRNGTPGAGGAFGRGGFGVTNLFLEPLIKMLQTRAGG
jgi:hypothetical protein